MDTLQQKIEQALEICKTSIVIVGTEKDELENLLEQALILKIQQKSESVA